MRPMAKGPAFPAFPDDAPAATVAAEVCSALFGDMQTYAPSAVVGEDEEAVHGMRVALRRLRTLQDALRVNFEKKPSKKMRKELRALARALGAVRDADVHLASLRAQRTASTVREAPGIDWMSERIRAERRAALAKLHDAYARFNDRVSGVFAAATAKKAAPIGPQIATLFAKSKKKYLRKGGRAMESGHPESLHRFRISGKRLRYLFEVCAETLGESSREPYRLLSEMQEDLGQINDAHDLIALYADLLDGMPPADPRRYGLHALIAARTQSRNAALEAVRARFPQLGTTFGN